MRPGKPNEATFAGLDASSVDRSVGCGQLGRAEGEVPVIAHPVLEGSVE
jgi:hypothetical protein